MPANTPELMQTADVSRDAQALLTPGASLAEYVQALVTHRHLADAVLVVAQSLTVPQAAWWGVLGSWARTVVERKQKTFDPALDELQRLILVWLREPSAAHRDALVPAAARASEYRLSIVGNALAAADRREPSVTKDLIARAIILMTAQAETRDAVTFHEYIIGVGLEILLGHCIGPSIPRPGHEPCS